MNYFKRVVNTEPAKKAVKSTKRKEEAQEINLM